MVARTNSNRFNCLDEAPRLELESSLGRRKGRGGEGVSLISDRRGPRILSNWDVGLNLTRFRDGFIAPNASQHVRPCRRVGGGTLR